MTLGGGHRAALAASPICLLAYPRSPDGVCYVHCPEELPQGGLHACVEPRARIKGCVKREATYLCAEI